MSASGSTIMWFFAPPSAWQRLPRAALWAARIIFGKRPEPSASLVPNPYSDRWCSAVLGARVKGELHLST